MLPFGILVDPLSAMMLVVVTTVSLLVQIYSRGYLWEPEAEEHGGDHGDEHAPSGRPRARRHRSGGTHGRTSHHRPAAPLVRDPTYGRFFAYLGLFTAAMLGLVLANNLLAIYMFWEGVGLGSYLLIGFWYSRIHQTGSLHRFGDRPRDADHQRPGRGRQEGVRHHPLRRLRLPARHPLPLVARRHA